MAVQGTASVLYKKSERVLTYLPDYVKFRYLRITSFLETWDRHVW